MRQFAQLVRDAPIGRILPVTVIRNSKPKVIRLKIDARKDNALLEPKLFAMQQPALEIDLRELETRLAETMARIKEAEARLRESKNDQAERQKALQQLEEAQKSLSEDTIAKTLLKTPSRRPTLGLFTDNLTTQLGDYFGVKDGKGVLITWVAQGSPSEKAGLKAGDVIVKIDDAAAPDRLTLARQLERKRSGSKIKVSVLRERNPMDFYLTVENEPGFKLKQRR
jgi:S1-C subfamily serine protease